MITFPRINQDPNTIKITYKRKEFHCHDLNTPGRVIPAAVPIIKDFLKELNKLPKKYCTTFPWYIFVFLFLWLVSFIIVMFSGLFFLIFIPCLFVIGFLVGMTIGLCHMTKFTNKVRRETENFKVRLRSYYTITDYFSISRGTGCFIAIPPEIHLNPIERVVLGNQNPPMMYQNPNQFVNPYNDYNMQPQPVPQPQQPIPVYTPNFNQNQGDFSNYQDQPLNQNNNSDNTPRKDGRV